MLGVKNLQILWDQITAIAYTVFHHPSFSDFVDIAIVAFVLYQLMVLTKKTRASAVLKGIVVLLLASGLANLFNLSALKWLLQRILDYGVLVLVILFQPEIRKALEQLGNKAKVEGSAPTAKSQSNHIIEEITFCLLNLSRRKVGALIVFEQHTGLNDVIETGTYLDANISASLLENIFEPNTPLHDGAVVIRKDHIMAAGCILSLSEWKDISRTLGTRHRAGLGVSETTDAVVLIVSEETGIISMAKGGELTRHLDAKSIKQILGGMYYTEKKGVLLTIKDSFLGLFKSKGKRSGYDE